MLEHDSFICLCIYLKRSLEFYLWWNNIKSHFPKIQFILQWNPRILFNHDSASRGHEVDFLSPTAGWAACLTLILYICISKWKANRMQSLLFTHRRAVPPRKHFLTHICLLRLFYIIRECKLSFFHVEKFWFQWLCGMKTTYNLNIYKTKSP